MPVHYDISKSSAWRTNRCSTTAKLGSAAARVASSSLDKDLLPSTSNSAHHRLSERRSRGGAPPPPRLRRSRTNRIRCPAPSRTPPRRRWLPTLQPPRRTPPKASHPAASGPEETSPGPAGYYSGAPAARSVSPRLATAAAGTESLPTIRISSIATKLLFPSPRRTGRDDFRPGRKPGPISQARRYSRCFASLRRAIGPVLPLPKSRPAKRSRGQSRGTTPARRNHSSGDANVISIKPPIRGRELAEHLNHNRFKIIGGSDGLGLFPPTSTRP